MAQMYLKIRYFCLSLLILAGCSENPHKIDVSGVDVDLELNRYEKDFFAIAPENFFEGFAKLRSKYPDKTEVMIEQVLGFGRIDDETQSFIYPLRQEFYNDPYLQELNDDIQSKYDDEKIETLRSELEHAFRHIKYYYPDYDLPELYTTLTSFTYSVINYEGLKAISLDMYMGQDYKYYPSLDYPRYKIRRMAPEYITPDVVMSVGLNKYPESEYADNTLLSKMLYEGKMLYFLDMMLPGAHDTLKIQYTEEQLQWSHAFEERVWEHFISKDLLYESEPHILDRYLNDGPFTSAPGIPHESAPRLGVWVGWQIIRRYMEDHPETTFTELMEKRDSRAILQQSGYRP